jgi:ABC-type Fe3+-hydroxamate transport system substrate-binding protein
MAQNKKLLPEAEAEAAIAAYQQKRADFKARLNESLPAP